MPESIQRNASIVLFSCLLAMSSVAKGEEITWKLASLKWEPYSGPMLENYGRSVQKLSHLLAKRGIRLEIEFFPWRRAQAIARTEEFVGYFPAWPSEVQSGFTASPPIDISTIAIMKRKDAALSYKTIDDLFERYRVGVVSTYIYPHEIDEAIDKHIGNAELARNELTLFRMLSGNRTDIAITDPQVMNHVAKQHNDHSIETHAVLLSQDLVIALRDSPETQQRIKLLKELLSK